MSGNIRTWFVALATLLLQSGAQAQDELTRGFQAPPDSARPGVYWYFMDGNLSREGMTADLESMKRAGIGHLIFLEVNVGVPRGPVDFMSEPWQALFAHAVREAERLGIEITLGSGPGWCGSGGPWVKAGQSMQHLVFSEVDVRGPETFDARLPVPEQRSTAWHTMRSAFYEDVAVYAFPRCAPVVADIDEKALYKRDPYSSARGVRPYLDAPAEYRKTGSAEVIVSEDLIDLSDRLQADGRLKWDVPAGEWTILRMGRRPTGASSRPAPQPGIGLECDKFDSAALDDHFEHYVGRLLKAVGPRKGSAGWTTLHIDSWEMGAQNWTPALREEFERRRGYDPRPFDPVYSGRIVGSLEKTERFLWDLRLTAQELVLENYAGRLKELGRRHGFRLSIEPYDMNPTSDLDLGAVADVPMCEFWADGFGFDTVYSSIEASSIAHTNGRPIVAAEAFTADSGEAWKLYPAAVKNQGDWAFCAGINRLVYHTFAHKPHGRRPGMTMGSYGVHWDRGQTWWPMAAAYHRYVTRCQFLLRQGQAVADVCYLAPEGAPHVFRPPPSALEGRGSLRDRRGYNFDGCSPNTLMAKASVADGRIVFPGGAAYRLLVLPSCETMTPQLLRKITALVESGATVVGPPPRKSPSLVDSPRCDGQVASLAATLWGQNRPPNGPGHVVERRFGRGRVVWGGDLRVKTEGALASRLIERAHWIWYPEGNPAVRAEAASRYFRRACVVDPEKRVRSAQLEITADNRFQVWINGSRVISGADFNTIYLKDVRPFLKPGSNVLAVEATNAGEGQNPAGLIAAVHVVYEDGNELVVSTDDRWQTARSVERDSRWRTSMAERWDAARALGPARMSPWRLKPLARFPDLYPHYESTARLLAEEGLPPDFEANGPLRSTHRRAKELEIYFVANRKAEVVEADCTFRVAGRQPELWDPLTGLIRNLPECTERAGRTTVPMRFEPHQSFFVVFRRPARPESPHGTRKNFATLQTLGQIDGPWDVGFDPGLGGPRQVTFATLEDWTQRAEPGVKYYSGIATYRKTFDLPAMAPPGEGPILLDLGVVHNLARVRLNGRDLGVVWCAPWRVDISQAVQTKENRLEIDVANLWPNRLIGDKALSSERPVAWTTYNPYQATSPLLPSGLLGPVRVVRPRS